MCLRWLTVLGMWLLPALYLEAGQCFGQFYHFQKISVKDGLPQNQCRALAFDSAGVLWVGTQEGGICRYDGQDIRIYTLENGLAGNAVRDLAFDQQGLLWVATTEGLSRFDGRQFTNFLQAPDHRINWLEPAPDGRVWFIDNWTGIGYVANGQVKMVSQGISGGQGDLKALYVSPDGRVWLGTYSQGLLLFDGESFRQVGGDKPLENKYFTFVKREDNLLQLATENGGYHLQADTLAFFPTLAAVSGVPVYSAFFDSQQTLWCGTNDGAIRFTHEGIPVFYNEANGLEGDIRDMLEDHEGGIWFATDYGIWRLRNEAFIQYTEEHGLNDRYITSVAFVNGDVWFTSDGGLQYIRHGQVNQPQGLPAELANNPRTLIAGPDNQLLVGSRKGLYAYDGVGYTFYPLPPSLSGENRYTCGLTRSNGQVLLGGFTGIQEFDGDSLRPFSVPFEEFGPPMINALVEDHQGQLWIATNGQGLYCKTPADLFHLEKTNNTEAALKGNPIPLSLPTNIINCLIVSKKGDLWLGTSGYGVLKLRNADPMEQVIAYGSQAQMPANIYSMVEDEDGYIWLGTDRGLTRLEIIQNDQIHLEQFGVAEGFQALEVFHNSVTISDDGNLWFGTVDGLTMVDRSKPLIYQTAPEPYLKNIQLFQRNVDWGLHTEALQPWTGIPKPGQLTLSNDQNTLSFFFAGITYDRPEKVTYRWKLEGYDDQWSRRTNRGYTIYANLPSGSYRFVVEAFSASGVKSEKACVYPFVITKPFYKTRIFFIACIAAIFVVSALYFQSRVKSLEEQQEKLQARVRERTYELEQQTKEIQRQRKKVEIAKEEIEEKNELLTKANEEQTASLKYAKRIQEIILSSSRVFAEVLPNSFYMDIPRNIVSGDFVWINETDEELYIALVDCTSHGVPAAFLSIIGNQLFNQIAKSEPGISPDRFLKLLDQQLRNVLRAGASNGNGMEINDGMDVALCRINKQTLKMVFAGAKRGVFYLEDQQIKFIKGSFSSIGIEFVGVEAKFDPVEIQLNKDSVIYLSSDGFYTQFGGKNGKRYKMSKFREFLFDIHHLEMNEQRLALAKEFRNWLNETRQMDDVLVVGFKVDQIGEKRI